MKIKKSYPSVEKAISYVKDFFSAPEDAKIAKVFASCITNTLQKTIHIQEDASVFVITGDIPAMWLRDSSCQLSPFLRFAKEEADIRNIFVGMIARQVKCILIDPYANAFNSEANGHGWIHDKTDMKPEVWERKFEVDSLCHPIALSWKLWKQTGETQHFTEDWKQASQIIINTFRIEQDHETSSAYRFERSNCIFTDTLSRDGRGALVKSNTGLIWSGFRPSDDACCYGYLIPSNMYASVILSYMAEILKTIYHDDGRAKEAQQMSEEIREAVEKYAPVPNAEKECYAYEVDGFGQYLVMDDANYPSLLSMPYFGWCSPEDERYQHTRSLILSDYNPYYYRGKVLRGIGSPHTPPGYVWDIALAMQGLTSTKREEKYSCIRMMVEADAGTGLMHESISVDNPNDFTRPWFSWANSMFCELVMDYCGM